MKNSIKALSVIALFTITISASICSCGGNSDEVMEKNGEKYHKVHLKCAKCDNTAWYWQSDEHEGTKIDYPRDRMCNGKYYCFKHYPD